MALHFLDNRYHSSVRSDIIPFVPQHGGALLDLGGGVGATALAIKDTGAAQKVGVIDLVDPVAGLDFSYCGDINDLDFLASVAREQGPFRTILCLDILEHLVEPWDVIRQLHKMLEPGGVIVASIPNVRHISVVAPLLLKSSWQLRDAGVLDRTHLRFFTKSSAVELMIQNGLELDFTKPIFKGGRVAKLFGWMPFAFLRDFGALQYIVRVRNGATSAAVC